MKRPAKGKAAPPAGARDIKQDFSNEQLAAVGAITLAFNELQSCMEAMLSVATHIPEWLFFDVSSRIYALDRKTEIIKIAIDKIVSTETLRTELKDTVGAFLTFKSYRDPIIHARILVAVLGIGISSERKDEEVLLTSEALNTFYTHILALEEEVIAATDLLRSASARYALSDGDPKISSGEEEIRDRSRRFRESRVRRQSLTPMPKFPTESELQKVETQALAVMPGRGMGWYMPWTMPGRQFPHWLHMQQATDVPLPLREEKPDSD